MDPTTLSPTPEISLFTGRQRVESQLAGLRSHPHNRAAIRHLKALRVDLFSDMLPVIELALWAATNRPEECTCQPSVEAVLTLAEWQLTPQRALNRLEESLRADDLADMEPTEAGVCLMLALTAPAE